MDFCLFKVRTSIFFFMEDDLKDLFKDTDATFQTPNLVTFSSVESSSSNNKPSSSEGESEQQTSKKTTKRKRAPPKAKAKKKTKSYGPSVLSQYADILDTNRPMSDFIVPDPTIPVPVPEKDVVQERALKKKRESLRYSLFRSMKEQGKGDNDIKAELKKVEQMSEDDIDFELQKVAYGQSEHFSEKVAQLIRDGAGWLAEKVIRADGKIQQEVESDQALKEALHKELMARVGGIGLKSQILLMLTGDIVHGKAKATLPNTNTNNTNNNNNNTPTNNNNSHVDPR